MNEPDRPHRRAADLLVDCLAAQGVDRIFCVPGESYLAFLDALGNSENIDLVTCRHEGGAGFMALADAKITRRPGVAVVSRGPGAANASIAVHMAEQDAAPMVLLIGQVARADRGRAAFQEVDYEKFFGGIAKGVREVGDATEIPGVVADMFELAQADTPGPVVISMPEDLLSDLVEADIVTGNRPAWRRPTETEVSAVMELLEKAKPAAGVIAGGALQDEKSRAALQHAANVHQLPVALSFKHQDLLDNADPGFAGYLGFKIPSPQVDEMSKADLIIAVGTRLTDTTTQNYTLPRAPKPDQPLVHIYPDENAIGRVFRTECGIAADPRIFLELLAAQPPEKSNSRAEWRSGLHKHATDLALYKPRAASDGVDFGAVVNALAAHMAPDTVILTDAGNFSSWVHRHWPWGHRMQLLGASGGGMGIAVPGAVAAALRCPGRQVLCFVGDGGALMTGSELATAVSRNVPVKIFISNNASYGTIRQHQERDYPTKVSGTDLSRPDFAKWAESLGAVGLSIRTEADVEGVVARALEEKRSVVVDVHSSLELISAYTTISEIRGNKL